MLEFNYALHDLERKNNKLKSKLRHNQLKNNSFRLNKSKRILDLALEMYKSNSSLVKTAMDLDLDKNALINAYIGGQRGNPEFQQFYLEINKIDGRDIDSKVYTLDNVGTNWVYTVIVDGKKISLISSDLNRLKEIIRDKNLPF